MLELTFALLLAPNLSDELFWPQPTAEMVKLVEIMGDDEFEVREKADKQLKEAGWSAMLAVKHGLKHKDAEIRRRCQDIYDRYFSVWTTKPVLICQLDYGTKFKTITIITRKEAVIYYMMAWLDAGHTAKEFWYDDAISMDAMKKYVFDLLRRGTDRKLVQELINETQGRPCIYPMTEAK